MNFGKLKKTILNRLESTDIISQFIWDLKIHNKLWPGTWDLTSLVLKRTLDKKIIFNSNIENYLDIGCGQMAILGQYLKKKNPKINVTSTDLHEDIVNCAQLNIKKNKLKINLFQSDLFENINEKFDLITFNPPYVSTLIKQNIPPDNRRFTSRYSGPKGTEITEKFLEKAKYHLTPNGRIFLGINCFYIPEHICLELIRDYAYKLEDINKIKFNTSAVFIIYL